MVFMSGGTFGIQAWGLRPKAAATARAHGAAAGAGLLSAGVALATGGLTKRQADQATKGWAGPITLAVKDLARRKSRGSQSRNLRTPRGGPLAEQH
jgi:hypothetical protein